MISKGSLEQHSICKYPMNVNPGLQSAIRLPKTSQAASCEPVRQQTACPRADSAKD